MNDPSMDLDELKSMWRDEPALDDAASLQALRREAQRQTRQLYATVAVECLGNCDNAPCLQVDGVDRGRMTRETAEALLREIEAK